MDIFSLTHKGKVRRQNEDKVCVCSQDQTTAVIVADGMGGQRAGQVASAKAVSFARDRLRNTDMTRLTGQDLKKLVEDAGSAVWTMAQRSESLKDMGTTFTLALLQKGRLLVAHVGDSRAYLLHESGLRQITRDHSYVQYLLEQGIITVGEAKVHPYKNMITRALGMRKVTADVFEEAFLPGDALLLCSDGLTGYVSDGEIRDCLKKPVSVRLQARELIGMALERGGGDNVSVIIAQNDGGLEKDD